ncbi:MAG: phage integrase N-terminal SAM-like domain-containing protein, partial [bacterium]
MAHIQDLDIALAIEIQGPDGVEIIHRGAERTGTRVGWNQPGMEPVMEIMQENPELAGHAQEIMNNVLAKSTIHGYQGAIRRYQDFCETEDYDRTIISEKSILHYLTHLHKNNVTVAVVNQVRPALSLMIEMYGGDTSVFTPRVDRWISAVKRLAANRAKKKPPVQKAGEVA